MNNSTSEMRQEKASLLARLNASIQIVLRAVSVPVAFYFLDNFQITSFFPNPAVKEYVLIVQFIFLSIAKIVFLSGALGNIARIANGSQGLFTINEFVAQAKRNWWLIALGACVPGLIHFGINMTTGQNYPFDAITSALNIPLLIIFAQVGKFTPPGQNRWQRKSISASSTMVIIAIYFMINSYAQLLRPLVRSDLTVSYLIDFCVKVMELSVFVFYIRASFVIQRTIIDQAHPQLILVNPPFSGIILALGSLAIRQYPPVFIVLKALTPKHWAIKEYNRILWQDEYYESGSLVGITCMTSNSAEAYRIAKEFRKRGSKVVMGGPHVSIFPEEALEFCDSVVVGPAESVWLNILSDYEQGNLNRVYEAPLREEEVSTVRSYLAEQPPLTIAGFLEIRRGCKFRCYFCANSALQKGPIQLISNVDQMVAFLKKVAQSHRSISFIDNNIYSDPQYMKELLRVMIPLKLRWMASSSIDIAMDDEVIDLLQKSGCTGLLIGYEIPAGSDEEQRGGKLALAQRYLQLTRKLKLAKIRVKAHFIYGFEKDDFQSLWRLWLFCFKLWPQATVLSLLTPIPGSAFFTEMAQKNELRDLNWRNYNLHTLVYAHKKLDNVLYRNAFSTIVFFFLCTTSTLGIALLSFCGLIISLAWFMKF